MVKDPDEPTTDKGPDMAEAIFRLAERAQVQGYGSAASALYKIARLIRDQLPRGRSH